MWPCDLKWFPRGLEIIECTRTWLHVGMRCICMGCKMSNDSSAMARLSRACKETVATLAPSYAICCARSMVGCVICRCDNKLQLSCPSVIPADEDVSVLRNVLDTFMQSCASRVFDEQSTGIVKLAMTVLTPEPLVQVSISSLSTLEAMETSKMLNALVNSADLPGMVAVAFLYMFSCGVRFAVWTAGC